MRFRLDKHGELWGDAQDKCSINERKHEIPLNLIYSADECCRHETASEIRHELFLCIYDGKL